MKRKPQLIKFVLESDYVKNNNKNHQLLTINWTVLDYTGVSQSLLLAQIRFES